MLWVPSSCLRLYHLKYLLYYSCVATSCPVYCIRLINSLLFNKPILFNTLIGHAVTCLSSSGWIMTTDNFVCWRVTLLPDDIILCDCWVTVIPDDIFCCFFSIPDDMILCGCLHVYKVHLLLVCLLRSSSLNRCSTFTSFHLSLPL